MHMTDAELDAIVESKLADRLAARLAADRERVRQEVISELRREETKKWHDRVNARHAVEGPLAGLTPEQDAERRRIMSEGVRRDMESMDRSNAKPAEGSLAATRAADRAGGSAGFKIG
jgi:hypothetical protein